MNDVERCPKCGSIYIQYDRITGKCYCLIKSCNHRWEQELDFDNIKNAYLRATIW